MTLVLYFGKKRWQKPLSLLECLEIPDNLRSYVSDYRINVFEISYLSDEQLAMFKSDFWFVADYFAQMRKNPGYIPPKVTIKHVNEVLALMRILTGDRHFEDAQNQYEGGQDKTMSEVMETIFDIKEREVEKRVTERVTQQLSAQFEQKSAEYELKLKEHILNEEALKQQNEFLKQQIAELKKITAN